jgi:hypothetical protein
LPILVHDIHRIRGIENLPKRQSSALIKINPGDNSSSFSPHRAPSGHCGSVRRCRPHPPTVRFASIAGILLRCRELAIWAITGHCDPYRKEGKVQLQR